jgi:hypothetical protein
MPPLGPVSRSQPAAASAAIRKNVIRTGTLFARSRSEQGLVAGW